MSDRLAGHHFLWGSCVCGWYGELWEDHVAELLVDAPLEPVVVE
ncbi:MAG: hypothetical protein ACKODT_07995 [Fluviibacter sp.]